MTICSCGIKMNVDRIGLTWLQRVSCEPYALFSCDRLRCPTCNNVAYLTANEPMARINDRDEGKLFEINMTAARSMGILVDGGS